ncbi:hypothetical protein [Priestia megaterium]|uniref:hypothetical protein n=1 Tax=Priestia megaterium TaxID=1404 RepID=UPI002877933C|nr:hypothetical protein [Priestia megaterium]
MQKQKIIVPIKDRIAKVIADNEYPKDAKIENIDYDSSVNLDDYDLRFMESIEHNGEPIGIAAMIDKGLGKMIKKELRSKALTEEEIADLKTINYKVGDVILLRELPDENDPYWKHNKITDTIYMPVKVEYIFNT